MRAAGLSALFLSLLAAATSGQEELTFGKKRYEVAPLDFEVAVPDGWQAVHDHTGMVAQMARRPAGPGFQVTREPMLFDPDGFAQIWRSQLSAAGIGSEVGRKKSGRYASWSAAWTADAVGGAKRSIEVWRLHVEDNEMLYNFAFSAPEGEDLEPLVEGVLRSFKCTADKPELEWQRTKQTIGTRVEITLPVGYEELPRGVRLGGGGGPTFVRVLPGYPEPHYPAMIRFQVQPSAYRAARLPFSMGVIEGGDDDIAEGYAEDWLKQLGEPRGKVRTRAARFGPFKGTSATCSGLSEQGIPKEIFVFVGKEKQMLIVVDIAVDAREVKLHKDLFKQICSKLEARE